MLTAFAPDPRLVGLVAGYWFVQDLPGEHAGKPITTCPFPGIVLSVNFGRPNAMVGGPLVPAVSLLGVQSVARSWLSWANTSFIMAILTAEGTARLFGGLGLLANRLEDAGGVLGDALALRLRSELAAVDDPRHIALAFDRWMLRRLSDASAPRGFPGFTAAQRALRTRLPVEAAAAAAGVSRRQLTRWYIAHTGHSPKQMMDLERLQASVGAAQRGNGDPVEGYSDQPHQIRSWRARIGTTPGLYRAGLYRAGFYSAGESTLASLFSSDPKAPVFYL